MSAAWQDFKNEVKRWRYLGVSALVSAVVTVAHVFDTYDEFWDVALFRGATVGLVLLNIFFTWLAVVLAAAAVNPTRKTIYAVLVALSFQAVLATEFEVQPLSGAETVGGSTTIKLAPFYTPFADQLTKKIDDPVEDEIAKEVAALRAKYPTEDSLPDLREELEDRLDRERSLKPESRKRLITELNTILATTTRTVRQRLRDVVQALYAESLREVVRDISGVEGG